MAQVCFDTSTFYTVMIVGISTILYVLYRVGSMPLQVQVQDPSASASSSLDIGMGMLAAHAERVEDLQRMHYPLTPPLRRGPFSYSGARTATVPVSIPTRGEYGSFEQIGFLHNTNNPDQAMPLIGRRIHSNKYEYYTFHHNNPQIKIPIKVTGDREISDGDSIPVHGYPNQLQAKIYDLDSPRYIPY
jgi:hypothetical protein